MNDSSSASVYLFKIEAVRIADSPAAPLLTLIVGPSEDSKAIVSVKRDKSARHDARRGFFNVLLQRASERTSLHSGRSATSGGYLGTSAGHPGVELVYNVTRHGTAVILWIDRGAGRGDWNEAVYAGLLRHKAQIEQAFGTPLEWHAKEGNRSRKLSVRFEEGGWMDEGDWVTVIDTAVGAMLRLKTSVQPFLAEVTSAADRSAPARSDGDDEDTDPDD